MFQISTVTSNLDDTCSTKLPFQETSLNTSSCSEVDHARRNCPVYNSQVKAMGVILYTLWKHWLHAAPYKFTERFHQTQKATNRLNLLFLAGMSVKEVRGGREVARAKSLRRFERCFSGLQLSMPIEAGGLKDSDPDKLKAEIKRWAKAVVTYARQVSGYFSSREESSSRTALIRSSSTATEQFAFVGLKGSLSWQLIRQS